MKRLFSLLMTAVMLLVSCGSSLQDELLTYINEDLAAVSVLEDEMHASLARVSGDNFTNDAAMYTEVSEVTLPLVTEMNTLAAAIVPENKELKAVHTLLCEYTAKYMKGCAALLSALESQDEALIDTANTVLEEAADLSVTYYDDLYDLAINNGIEFNE